MIKSKKHSFFNEMCNTFLDFSALRAHRNQTLGTDGPIQHGYTHHLWETLVGDTHVRCDGKVRKLSEICALCKDLRIKDRLTRVKTEPRTSHYCL